MEPNLENGDCKERNRRMRKLPDLVIFIGSLLISIGGGFLLGCWVHKYHPTNRQLWMVPFGLILLLTPLILWFSILISDLGVIQSEEDDDDAFVMSQRILPKL